jgi:hypothetical protein
MKNLFYQHNIQFSMPFYAALPFLIALLLSSCGGGDGTSTAERLRQDQLNEVKEGVLAEINNLKNEIDKRIEYLEVEGGTTTGNQVDAQLLEYRKELNQQNELLAKEYQNVQDATFEEWNDIVENASETINQVSQRTNEITREIREIVE